MTITVGPVGNWSGSRLWNGAGPGQAEEAAAELDELGYGAIWFGASDGDLVLPERVLGATSRMTVATGVVNVWSEPAEDVAEAFHRVDDAHPGRFLLGIGAGHAVFVEQEGQVYERPYSKVVDYLDRLDAAARPVPVSRRVVAALGPRTLRLAAERSAGAHPYLVTPEHTRMARETMGAGPLLAPEQKVVLAPDRDTARVAARPALELYLGLPNYVANLRRLGFTDDDLAGLGSDRLFDRVFAWGDPEAIADRVREHHEAGADHVAVQVLTTDGGLPRGQWRELASALLG